MYPPDRKRTEDARLFSDLLLWPPCVSTDPWPSRLRTNPTSLREYRGQPSGHDSSIAGAPTTDRESVTEIASASPQCEGLVRATPWGAVQEAAWTALKDDPPVSGHGVTAG